ncbi:recombinase family protein [Pleomorphomonas sp. NRK KF1]|uniref:recombinase family protein n=1 Tax=Pleomorphomonas sp. NRK KF1 TaxID=2943000 RepID=UPI0020435BAD|nr:recombinase family protein [Pleomorphomonas sp. NRK KF1]MCM5552403.1 recombinase family protein [Pleomorphomonas sp. NRK KF1]
MFVAKALKPAVAYVRVSTQKQGESGVGLEGQRAAIRARADAEGFHIIGWFQDVASARGERNLDYRTGLRNALKLAKRERATLLLDRIDRISRHKPTFDKIMTEFGDLQIVLASEDSAMDPLVLASKAARAEAEGDLISRRTREALGILKDAGIRLGNPINLPEAQKKGAEANMRRAMEKHAEIAEAILANRWQSLAVSDLAAKLNDLGIRTGRDRPWTASALRRPRKAALHLLKQAEADAYGDNSLFGRF